MFPIYQTGFISGRSTHLVVLQLFTILNLTFDLVLPLLDYNKAYDQVSQVA